MESILPLFVAAVQFYHVDYFERETNIFVATDKESFQFSVNEVPCTTEFVLTVVIRVFLTC